MQLHSITILFQQHDICTNLSHKSTILLTNRKHTKAISLKGKRERGKDKRKNPTGTRHQLLHVGRIFQLSHLSEDINKLFQFNHIDFWKRDFFKNIIMPVLTDNKASPCCYRTINKLVVILIIFYQSHSKCWFKAYNMFTVQQRLNYIFGNKLIRL